MEKRITLDYAPRSVFVPYHNRVQRWAIIVAHRRCGKTVATINDLIRRAITHDKPEGRFAYIAPYYAQAKDVAWSYLKRFSAPLLAFGGKINESELALVLPTGAVIRLYGADNYDRLRGIYLDGVVLDEYADMPPQAWSEVLRPALSDRKGWATFIGTPRGHNGFYDLWQLAKSDPEWFSLELKASETGIISAEELSDARRNMSDDQYAQEFECSFDAAIVGAYYGKELARAEEEGRISRVPYDPVSPVITAWDLGMGDSTAIWFAQQIGREVRLIDYYESQGMGLDHYVRVLNEKKYLYGDHILPHDASVRELGTGKSRLETLFSLGIRARVLPNQSVDDGINAARLLIARSWFDSEKCKYGIEALKQYRAEWDEKRKVQKPRPLHDWTSHCADAFRYLALGIRNNNPAGLGISIKQPGYRYSRPQ
jgi:hypothetical protein